MTMNTKEAKDILDEQLNEYLHYEPSWSAAHHQTGKTWGERATTIPDKEEGKK